MPKARKTNQPTGTTYVSEAVGTDITPEARRILEHVRSEALFRVGINGFITWLKRQRAEVRLQRMTLNEYEAMDAALPGWLDGDFFDLFSTHGGLAESRVPDLDWPTVARTEWESSDRTQFHPYVLQEIAPTVSDKRAARTVASGVVHPWDGDTRKWLRRLKGLHDRGEILAIEADQLDHLFPVWRELVTQELADEPTIDEWKAAKSRLMRISRERRLTQDLDEATYLLRVVRIANSRGVMDARNQGDLNRALPGWTIQPIPALEFGQDLLAGRVPASWDHDYIQLARDRKLASVGADAETWLHEQRLFVQGHGRLGTSRILDDVAPGWRHASFTAADIDARAPLPDLTPADRRSPQPYKAPTLTKFSPEVLKEIAPTKDDRLAVKALLKGQEPENSPLIDDLIRRLRRQRNTFEISRAAVDELDILLPKWRSRYKSARRRPVEPAAAPPPAAHPFPDDTVEEIDELATAWFSGRTERQKNLLAHWRRQLRDGNLSPEREAFLDARLPRWSDTSPIAPSSPDRRLRDEAKRIFTTSAAKVEAMVRTWGTGEPTSWQRAFLSAQRQSYRAGTIGAERQAFLDEYAPGWSEPAPRGRPHPKAPDAEAAR